MKRVKSQKLMALKKRDELYAAAVDIVVREGRGSVSLLQRALGIGYGRAARLVDYMAVDGIVGNYAGSQLARSSFRWTIGKQCRVESHRLLDQLSRPPLRERIGSVAMTRGIRR